MPDALCRFWRWAKKIMCSSSYTEHYSKKIGLFVKKTALAFGFVLWAKIFW
jgi:hypothetical protein